MNTRNGCRNRKQYLPMLEMCKAEQFIIQSCQRMIPKIEIILRNIVFQFLMNMENRKPEFVKAKEQNICGRKFLFQ